MRGKAALVAQGYRNFPSEAGFAVIGFVGRMTAIQRGSMGKETLFRVATGLLERYGHFAVEFADKRSKALSQAGQIEAASTWMMVLDTLLAIEAAEPDGFRQ